MEFALAFRMIGALAVIGLVLLAVQLLVRAAGRKRLTLPGRDRLVTIVETTHLPSAASLHVVKIGEAYAVIGRSGAFIGKVADLPDAAVAGWLARRDAPPAMGIALVALVRHLRKVRPFARR
jgi:flagellar biogenesis protein FliO